MRSTPPPTGQRRQADQDPATISARDGWRRDGEFGPPWRGGRARVFIEGVDMSIYGLGSRHMGMIRDCGSAATRSARHHGREIRLQALQVLAQLAPAWHSAPGGPWPWPWRSRRRGRLGRAGSKSRGSRTRRIQDLALEFVGVEERRSGGRPVVADRNRVAPSGVGVDAGYREPGIHRRAAPGASGGRRSPPPPPEHAPRRQPGNAPARDRPASPSLPG